MHGTPVEARGTEAGAPLVHVHLKVVPGASQEGVVGRYGDRLKLRVTAPPASGKANQAVLALLSQVLDVPLAHLTLVRGASTSLKTVAVRGLDAATVGGLLSVETP